MQKKKGPYQRRLFTPRYPDIPKTTTPEGRRLYNMFYAREIRALGKKPKQLTRAI